MNQSQPFAPEGRSREWRLPAQRRLEGGIYLLLLVPMVALLGFLVYYFFIQGYAIRMQPHPTISGDCNGGTMTVKANATRDTVFMSAGLLTIEGYGNLDGANNILNVSGNMCGFTLSVPAETNLHLSGNDATLSVTGLTGKLELDNNAGDIIINDSSLLAGSVISNNAGNTTINHSHVGPNATISSNDSPVHLVSSTIDASILESGQFQLENSTLMGAVQIQDQVQIQGVTTLSNATITTSEAITFPNSRVTGFTKIIGNGSAVTYAGTLAAGSSLTIVNNGGTETITLPAALAFHLDASGVNSFSSNDPALQALDPKALASSDGAHVDVGAHPQVIVAVQGQGDTFILNRGGA